MPTIIEAIAPKGFEYYTAVPSAFDEQPDVHVTPYQWITSDMLGGCARRLRTIPNIHGGTIRIHPPNRQSRTGRGILALLIGVDDEILC